LVYADVEVKKKGLNLVGLKDFTSPLGKYNLGGNLYMGTPNSLSELYSDLRAIFNKEYEGHENDIVIFLSPIELLFARSSGISIHAEFYGHTNSIIDKINRSISFSKEILLFPARQAKSKLKTMAHESGHALGLFHTWLEDTEDKGTQTNSDGTEIEVRKISNDKKQFVFGGNEEKLTHNLMSYSKDAPPKTLWKWQWDIIHGR